MDDNNGKQGTGSMESPLEKKSVTLELATRVYTFQEPGKRRARELLSTIGTIDKLYGKLSEVDLHAMAAINNCLDFLYDACPEMSDDSEYLDEEADYTEIMTAYKQVVGVLTFPFAGGKGVQNSLPSGMNRAQRRRQRKKEKRNQQGTSTPSQS